MTVESLFQEHKLKLCKRMDRAFAHLMLLQWLLAVIIAMNSVPAQGRWTATGTHLDVWMSVILGGLLASLPLYFAFFNPGKMAGRYTTAFAQMGFSTLFVHLTNGSMEAHFHIFVSLAFLSIYREWELLVVAAIATTITHLVQESFITQSLLNIAVNPLQWHWLKHTGWILFEAVFLSYACVQSTKEMRHVAVTKSELINARIEAEQLSLQRGNFFSLVSHEIRTPLNGIIGFTEFLNNSPIPTEEREYVCIIKQCSETLLKLINDLLDFSKIDSGKLDIDPHAFRPREIQDYLENIFHLESKRKNLEFVVDADPEVPETLYGDSHRIRQVLTNIVGNAIKFTDHGSIKVRVQRHETADNLYCWEVTDTGIGIKKDNLQRIFSPYTQEFSSTARRYGGSGLGLAISKTLIELMGGQLKVNSIVGKGSVFSFTLPLREVSVVQNLQSNKNLIS